MSTSMTTEMREVMRPPEPPGPIAWLQKNLFNNWYNSLLTVLALGFIVWASVGIYRWVFFTADWEPVSANLMLYLVGQYPREALWRLGAIITIMAFLFGMSWRRWGGVMRTFAVTFIVFIVSVALWPAEVSGFTIVSRGVLLGNILVLLAGYLVAGWKRMRNTYLLLGWLISLPITLLLLSGVTEISWLPPIATGMWGGMIVTLLLAIGGITISFPIGVFLALGRRSSLPVVSLLCTAFIEVIRGVPLIGLLFLSSLILPLFLPPDVRIDRLLRALIGMTLFSAAYTAENVRGGLAAVPNGQVEAARSLGMGNLYITTMIVLPQALRAVIPPIVGQFISLFKDTTLASGVAVLELLSIGRSILQSDPKFIGLQMEVYLFVALVFWIFSYLMSYASQRLEVALGVGER